MTEGKHITQEDLALYALQSLSQDEASAVRQHLATCAMCREELAEVSGDLAMVALSVEQHPVPVGARQRFMDRIAAAPAKLERTPAIPIDSRRPIRAAAMWVPWAAVAALVVVAIALGFKVQSLNQQTHELSAQADALAATNARAQEVLEVLTAPAAQRVVLTAAKTHPAPAARAFYLASRGALILQASNLEPLPGDKTYELWVIPANGGAPIPAGLFRPDTAGSASLVLPDLPAGVAAKAFGVTIEKASGANTPTAPIILSGAAPAAGE